ncbi:hypothetical protein DITRI_Ditri15bG0071400 [Diplodiscus trichospermus]
MTRIHNDRWEAPSTSWFKINYNASYRKANGKAHFGVIIRDHAGRLLDGVNDNIEADCALVAKAWAVREGINLALNRNLYKVIFEMDSTIVCSEINSNSNPMS